MTTRPKTRHRTGAATTINPDHVGMHRVIVLGVILTLLAAVITSWNGLVWVAGEQLLPPELHPVTPVMIDIPLVVLTLARGALRKRGIRARGLLLGIIAITTYSSLANLFHSIAVGGFVSVGEVEGALTNGAAPWFILAMTEVLWLVVTRPPRVVRSKSRTSKRSRRTTATRPVAEPTLFGDPATDPIAARGGFAQ